MFANWKSAIYEYAHRCNQLEVDGDPDPLVPMIRNDRYLQSLQQRLRRLGASRKSRRIAPLRAETGLKLRAVDENARQAIVELELRRGIEYEQAGRSFREDRIERERITLNRQKHGWLISDVSLSVPERRPLEGPPPRFEPVEGQDGGHWRPRSVPYLNERVFSSVSAGPAFRSFYYDRRKAQQYAETWWNGTNPEYERFEVDCTNFVSQCLFAGGAPMNYTGKRESGWWYQGRSGSAELWSFSWAVAHSLYAYLSSSKTGLRAETVDSPRRLAIGDVICYDWDGNGRYQHNTIVTAFDAAGMPLVNAHTIESRARYWDYRDSHAWTPSTRYRFFHIADVFD